MQKKLKPGMYVMLRDGLFGTIVDVQEKEVVINFSVDGADEGCLTVGKDSIYNIVEQAAGTSVAPANGHPSAAEATAEPGSIAERLQHAAAVEAAEDAKDAEALEVTEKAEDAENTPETKDAEETNDLTESTQTETGNTSENEEVHE